MNWYIEKKGTALTGGSFLICSFSKQRKLLNRFPFFGITDNAQTFLFKPFIRQTKESFIYLATYEIESHFVGSNTTATATQIRVKNLITLFGESS